MVCQSRRTPRRKIDSKQNVAKEFVEPWVKFRSGGLSPSGVTDNDSRAFLAEHAPLFGLRAPVPTFLSAEEAQHA
jgi:hypothetical protein